MPREPITHLVIARACDADPDGAHAQALVGHTSEPDVHGLTEIRANISALFRRGFGREPERVGVAVLPWVGELDEDERYDDEA